MNLHGIVRGAIQAVNPDIPVIVKVSRGYATADDGKRTPKYATPCEVMGQVQNLTFRDLQQLDGLNLQGERRAIYLNGNIDGLVRSENKGGDLITVTCGPAKGVWLVAQVLESWPDWCKVAATLQVDKP